MSEISNILPVNMNPVIAQNAPGASNWQNLIHQTSYALKDQISCVTDLLHHAEAHPNANKAEISALKALQAALENTQVEFSFYQDSNPTSANASAIAGILTNCGVNARNLIALDPNAANDGFATRACDVAMATFGLAGQFQAYANT